MAIDMCSESFPLITSPRISFSHDLCHIDDDDDTTPTLDHTNRLTDTNPDEFDFSFGDGIGDETSTADELFSDGLIRPLQLPEKFATPPKHSPLPPLPHHDQTLKQNNSSKEIASTESEEKHQSKSFWRVKRSSSIHCDNSHKKSSFWSLPLLLRSKSTGSVPSTKQIVKEKAHKQNSQKLLKSCSSSSSSSSSFYMYQLSQKPAKKNHGGSYGNVVRISPVLNMPPPYIAKGTANLFGLGSLFRDKNDINILNYPLIKP